MIELDDILKSEAPKTRKEGFDIDGLGEVAIYELSVTERAQFFEDSTAVYEGKYSDEDFTDKWLWRLLAGPNRKAKKSDYKKLRDTLTQKQVETILNKGFDYSVENLEKK